MRRRIAGVITAICMAFVCMPLIADQALAADEIHISNYADLETCIEGVNNGTIAADTNIFIDENITVPEEVGNDWVPLAKDMDHAYQGALDGRGHTISGIKIHREYQDPWEKGVEVHNFTAFISFLGASGSVSNLEVKADIYDVNDAAGVVSQNYGTITECIFEGNLETDVYPNEWDEHAIIPTDQYFTDFNSESGGIAAMNAGTISSCKAGNEHTLSTEDSTKITRGGAKTGGIVGFQLDGGVVTGCINYATVTTAASMYKVDGHYEGAGGIVGAQQAYMADPAKCPRIDYCINHAVIIGDLAVAGICANTLGGSIAQCINLGTINVYESGAAGGIAAFFQSADKVPSQLFDCSNSGNVVEEGNIARVGGIVGHITNNASMLDEPAPFQVYNCKNTGQVEGGSHVGGVIGLCDVYETKQTKAYNLVNLGKVSGTTAVGGVVGGCSGILTESVNFGTVTATDYTCDQKRIVGGIVGNLEPAGVVYESYNLGPVNDKSGVEGIFLGGVAGGCHYDMTGCYYCMDTAGDAKGANGYNPEDPAGALTLKEMVGDAAAVNMKDMFEHSSGHSAGSLWNTVADRIVDGTHYGMTPELDAMPATFEEILAAGIDTSYKLKSSLASQTVVTPDSEGYAYTGKPIEPFFVTVTYRGQELADGDYRIYTCFNNVSVGEATVIVIGTGQYCDATQGTFNIVPAKANVAKAAPGKKKLTVKMGKKVSKLGGATYEIQYCVNGTEKWKAVKTTKQKITIKKLKKGKKYEVRARAIKEVKGKTYTGDWSDILVTKKVK